MTTLGACQSLTDTGQGWGQGWPEGSGAKWSHSHVSSSSLHYTGSFHADLGMTTRRPKLFSEESSAAGVRLSKIARSPPCPSLSLNYHNSASVDVPRIFDGNVKIS